MKMLNVGCGKDVRLGWTNIDNHDRYGAEVVFDLNQIYKGKKMPFRDNTFDHVLMDGALYLFLDPVPIINELIRVCKRDGMIEIHTVTPNNVTSMNFIRGHTRTQFIHYAKPDSQDNYSPDKQKKSRISLIECKYHADNFIKKIICSFYNLLPPKIVDQTFIGSLFALGIKVKYKKLNDFVKNEGLSRGSKISLQRN